MTEWLAWLIDEYEYTKHLDDMDLISGKECQKRCHEIELRMFYLAGFERGRDAARRERRKR